MSEEEEVLLQRLTNDKKMISTPNNYNRYLCAILIFQILLTILVCLQMATFVTVGVLGAKKAIELYPDVKKNVLDFEKELYAFVGKLEKSLEDVDKNIRQMTTELQLIGPAFSALIECSCKGTQCVCGLPHL